MLRIKDVKEESFVLTSMKRKPMVVSDAGPWDIGPKIVRIRGRNRRKELGKEIELGRAATAQVPGILDHHRDQCPVLPGIRDKRKVEKVQAMGKDEERQRQQQWKLKMKGNLGKLSPLIQMQE